MSEVYVRVHVQCLDCILDGTLERLGPGERHEMRPETTPEITGLFSLCKL